MAAALLFLVPHVAVAEEPCPTDVSAEQLAREGKDLLKKGDQRGAYDKFRCAYENLKSYDVTGNLGLAELSLKMFPQAAQHLTEAVRLWPTFTDEKRQRQKAQVEEQLTSARGQVLAVIVEVNRADAAVYIDGGKVGRSPLTDPVFVEPGRHHVSAHIEGLATQGVDVDGVAGGEVTAHLTIINTALAPPPSLPPGAEPSDTAGPADRGVEAPPYHAAWLSLPIAASVAGTVVAVAMHVRVGQVNSDIAGLQLAVAQRDGAGSHCVAPAGLDALDCDTLGRAYAARDYNATGGAVSLGAAAGATLITGGLVLGRVLAEKRRGPFHPGWFAAPLAIGAVAFGAGAGLQVHANSLGRGADDMRQALYDQAGGAPCSAQAAQCQTLSNQLASYDAFNNAALGMAIVGGAASVATAGMAAYYFGAARKSERADAPVDVLPLMGRDVAGFALAGSW